VSTVSPVASCVLPTCDADSLFDRWGETIDLDGFRPTAGKMLVDQLARVHEGSPFLRRKFADAGLELGDIAGLDDLARIPLTTKDELRASQEQNWPYGDYLVADPDKIKRVYQTSGTTGRPSLLALTADDLAMMTAVGSRSYRALGVHEHHRVLVTTGAGPYIAGQVFMVLENLRCGVVPVGPGNADKVISALVLGLVDTAILTPSFALYLIDRFARDGIDPSGLGLVNLFVGGEPGAGLPEVRRQIDAAFGVRIRELMGIGDVCGALFAECEFGGGMHFNGHGYIWPELIDATDQVIPIVAGATGELVYTALVREAMPMVRFRSRDFVEIVDTECDCGRVGFRQRVLGRVDDMFIVRGVNVYPSAVQSILAEFRPAVTGRCRVILPPSGQTVAPPVPIEVEVNNDADANDGLAERIEGVLRARLTFRAKVALVSSSQFGDSDYKTKATVRRASLGV
jgi:phenylacetate-CoA ligase